MLVLERIVDCIGKRSTCADGICHIRMPGLMIFLASSKCILLPAVRESRSWESQGRTCSRILSCGRIHLVSWKVSYLLVESGRTIDTAKCFCVNILSYYQKIKWRSTNHNNINYLYQSISVSCGLCDFVTHCRSGNETV